jgi:hypothetical protein
MPRVPIRLSKAFLVTMGALLPLTIVTVHQDVGEKPYIGSIDNRLGIRMTLKRSDGSLQGSYYYDRIHTPIRVQGTVDSSNRIVLDEFDQTGAITARFTGKLVSEGVLAGSWTRAGHDQGIPFLLEAESGSGVPVGARDRAIVVEETVVVQHRQSKENLPAGWDKDVVVHYPRISGLADKSGQRVGRIR